MRMDRENAEKRVRDMEDQMAEFQDELRRESSNKTVSQTFGLSHTHTNTDAPGSFISPHFLNKLLCSFYFLHSFEKSFTLKQEVDVHLRHFYERVVKVIRLMLYFPCMCRIWFLVRRS